MSFTNVHNEFKIKLRKTGGDSIVHSSEFTLPSFLKWLNIRGVIEKFVSFSDTENSTDFN